MKIAISADHRGAPVFEKVNDAVRQAGHEVVPVPTCEAESCDYPEMAWAAGSAVADHRADRGVLICGSGIGMSMAANKIRGVRAALCHDEQGAELSRRHNDANVICLSADSLPPEQIVAIVLRWLNSPFDGGRHARRIRKMEAIEDGRNPVQVS